MPWSCLQHAKIRICEENSFAPKFASWGGYFYKIKCASAFGGGGERGKRLTCSLLFSPLSLFKWEMLGKRQ